MDKTTPTEKERLLSKTEIEEAILQIKKDVSGFPGLRCAIVYGPAAEAKLAVDDPIHILLVFAKPKNLKRAQQIFRDLFSNRPIRREVIWKDLLGFHQSLHQIGPVSRAIDDGILIFGSPE